MHYLRFINVNNFHRSRLSRGLKHCAERKTMFENNYTVNNVVFLGDLKGSYKSSQQNEDRIVDN